MARARSSPRAHAKPRAKPRAKAPAATRATRKQAPAASPTAARRTTAADRKATATRKPAATATRQAPPAKPRARPPGRKPPPARLSGGSPVVKVLESRQPIEALRKFLARIPDQATMEQGQIALGSAQLMLLPIAHEHRGGDEVKQLLDLVLARWDAFPDRGGFHAQEFLRNAFAAVGDDRDRIARLSALVPPDATPLAPMRATMSRPRR